MRSLLVGAVAAAVVMPLSVVVPQAAASARPGPGTARGAVEARVGDLTTRTAGTPGTGARRLTSATVRQDLYADRVTGTFVLDAAPTGPSTTSYLRVGFGHTDDAGTCVGDQQYYTDTLSPADGFTRSGRTLTLARTDSRAGYMDWDCAFALLDADLDGEQSSIHSVLGGSLRDVATRPDLAVTKVQLLGKGRIGLVRGVWTTLEVTVGNRGTGDSTGTVVTGAGKGVKVRRAGLGTIRDDDTGTARVQVKLVGTRATRVRVTASGGGDRATRTVRVRKVAPPAGPTPGRYAGAGGDVKFDVVKGRVTGFRIRTVTTCGAFPDVPTTTVVTYDFPTVRIARNGIVDARQKGRLFSAYLRLRIARGTVTQARFQYFGPSWCRASESFTARRVGG
ncbi:hypothetical protein [Nocardioides sp. 1609]|uniref:hypothetical protein n=1 Tax=Nocardioides sp. 1609 TaxID=2508327 RepID=UPI00106FDDCD|nr:hypothetical protein [Nocardioides sp. 1609]